MMLAATTVGDVVYDAATIVLVPLVYVGAIPLVVATYQFDRVGLHRWFSHLDKTEIYLPRVAIIIPAWNEGAVLGASLDRLLGMDYPPESLRLYVVDDASTDDTPAVVVSAFEAAVWSLPAVAAVNVSTPAAFRLNVAPIRPASLLASPLVSAAEIAVVLPSSLLITVLPLPATAPDAFPRMLCPL